MFLGLMPVDKELEKYIRTMYERYDRPYRYEVIDQLLSRHPEHFWFLQDFCMAWATMTHTDEQALNKPPLVDVLQMAMIVGNLRCHFDEAAEVMAHG